MLQESHENLLRKTVFSCTYLTVNLLPAGQPPEKPNLDYQHVCGDNTRTIEEQLKLKLCKNLRTTRSKFTGSYKKK